MQWWTTIYIHVIIQKLQQYLYYYNNTQQSDTISDPPSFCGACLNFSREKDSAIPSLVDREVEICEALHGRLAGRFKPPLAGRCNDFAPSRQKNCHCQKQPSRPGPRKKKKTPPRPVSSKKKKSHPVPPRKKKTTAPSRLEKKKKRPVPP